MPSPNILIFHCDQLRFDALGCNGNTFAATPNIDRLAEGGTRFTRHITANPVCMPSRASFFTGVYPPGHGVFSNGVPLNRREFMNWPDPPRGGNKAALTLEPPTMADVFAQAGYDTASLGKLHLRPNVVADSCRDPESWMNPLDHFATWNGPYYGFRHVETTAGHGEHPAIRGCHYALWLHQEHPEVVERVHAGPAEPRPAPAEPELYASSIPGELHHSAWLADRCIEYLEKGRPKEKPFFAFVGFPDPHHPFCPPIDLLNLFRDAHVHEPTRCEHEPWERHPGGDAKPQAIGKSLTAEQKRDVIRYTYAMVHGIDRAVGRVLDHLNKRSLDKNTIVVFTSDHGDYLCDHDRLRKCGLASDPLVHVPLIIRTPDHRLPRTINTPASNVDVMPTLGALAGVPMPHDLHGSDLTREATRAAHHAFVFSSIVGRNDLRNYTVYDHDHRLTWYPRVTREDANHAEGFVELFNHPNDPGECRNLAASGEPRDSDRVREMMGVICRAMPRFDNPSVGRVGPY